MIKLTEQDIEDGIKAARAIARYELGDPTWGNAIVSAFLNPKITMEALEIELANV